MNTRVTPIHLRVLELVRDRQIMWRASTGPYGGFGDADGSRIPPSDDLVALYELRDAGLIVVDKDSGPVAVTAAGMSRLARKYGKQPLRQLIATEMARTA